MNLEKACLKAKISPYHAKELIATHHELKYLTPKKKLVTLNLNLSQEAVTRIKTIATALKITQGAVITAFIRAAVNFEGIKP